MGKETRGQIETLLAVTHPTQFHFTSIDQVILRMICLLENIRQRSGKHDDYSA